jgi:hypothetical protein
MSPVKKGHKIEAETWTGGGAYNGYVCRVCGKALTVRRTGPPWYAHQDYTPQRGDRW